MSAKKQVVVRIDSKGASSSKSTYNHVDIGKKLVNEEVAAAEETSDNKIHTFARNYDASFKSHSTSKQQTNLSMFKPIIIAIISAITIGSIMGVVMLKLIVNFDNDLNGTPAIALPTDGEDNADNKEGQGNISATETYTIDSMSAYVLQGGVFSTASNAEAESGKFVEQGYSPVIWEKDSQYFLLVKMGYSKEDLQSDTNSLKESGIEVYAKEWQSNEKEVELTKEEYDWLVTFQEQWNLSLGQGTLDVESWQALIDQAPNSNKLSSFITSIEDQVISNESTTEVALLALWSSLNSILSTER